LEQIECGGSVPRPICGTIHTVLHQDTILLIHSDGRDFNIYALKLGNETTNPTNPTNEVLSVQNIDDEKVLYKDNVDPLISSLKQLLNEKLFTDITFEVEQEHIPAHKAILVSRSDYFKRMLTSKIYSNI